MSVNNIDIFGVAESWAHEYIIDAELALPGYILFRQDRGATINKKRGGGVLMCVRDSITVDRVGDDGQNKSESLWIEVQTFSYNNKTVIIGVCYSSPSATT